MTKLQVTHNLQFAAKAASCFKQSEGTNFGSLRHGKRVLLSLTAILALLLARGAQAETITLSPEVTGTKIGTGYLPKLASDGQNAVASIAETGTGLNDLENLSGQYDVAGVSWVGSFSFLYSPPQTTPQVGHAPSIALVFEQAGYLNHDNAIEVHQGGQEKESSLWFQLGTNNLLSSKNINWLASKQYDNGYNPTVAAEWPSVRHYHYRRRSASGGEGPVRSLVPRWHANRRGFALYVEQLGYSA